MADEFEKQQALLKGDILLGTVITAALGVVGYGAYTGKLSQEKAAALDYLSQVQCTIVKKKGLDSNNQKATFICDTIEGQIETQMNGKGTKKFYDMIQPGHSVIYNYPKRLRKKHFIRPKDIIKYTGKRKL